MPEGALRGWGLSWASLIHECEEGERERGRETMVFATSDAKLSTASVEGSSNYSVLSCQGGGRESGGGRRWDEEEVDEVMEGR